MRLNTVTKMVSNVYIIEIFFTICNLVYKEESIFICRLTRNATVRRKKGEK